MFNFILKNALTKKSKIILTPLTIILSCTVGILAINVSNQVNDGIIELSGGYDLVIGPAGSDSQLAYNALFFSDNSLGTIEESYYDELNWKKYHVFYDNEEKGEYYLWHDDKWYAFDDNRNAVKIDGSLLAISANFDVKVLPFQLEQLNIK